MMLDMIGFEVCKVLKVNLKIVYIFVIFVIVFFYE